MRPSSRSHTILARMLTRMSSWVKSKPAPCTPMRLQNMSANTPQSKPFCCRGMSAGYTSSQPEVSQVACSLSYGGTFREWNQWGCVVVVREGGAAEGDAHTCE